MTLRIQSFLLFVRFKFQSDSINTGYLALASVLNKDFKFQSDSINTHQKPELINLRLSLNSNLILLIR